MAPYLLPDGRTVAIHADVARGAPIVTYQLADGRIVEAVRPAPHAPERGLIHTPASLSATAVVTHCQACGVWLPARPVLFRGGTLCGTSCAARWEEQLDRR